MRDAQITFDGVKGYATYANAEKRGKEVAELAKNWAGPTHEHTVKWLVVAKADGRFVPAFNVNNFPGGPGVFLGLTNVCVFN